MSGLGWLHMLRYSREKSPHQLAEQGRETSDIKVIV
jgi:hypothetical protein